VPLFRLILSYLDPRQADALQHDSNDAEAAWNNLRVSNNGTCRSCPETRPPALRTRPILIPSFELSDSHRTHLHDSLGHCASPMIEISEAVEL
jgi:hypothetical protein